MELDTDGKRFELATADEWAWPADKEADHQSNETW